ncbi:MAG: hypothetical protein V1918_02650 [Planctomycetota bacterium]
MAILEEIREQNETFLGEFAPAALGVIEASFQDESHELIAPESLKSALNTTGFYSRYPPPETVIQQAASAEDAGRVQNLFSYLGGLYRRVTERLGALSYEGQAELDRLLELLHEGKAGHFDSLSQSIVRGLEAIMELDQAVLEAKSRRKIDKTSYTGVRGISLQQEATQKNLEALGRRHGTDVAGVYESLEEMRLKIVAHERKRVRRLRQGGAGVLQFFREFLSALEPSLQAMTTLGPFRPPAALDIYDCPSADKRRLGGTFEKMLAADRTLALPDPGGRGRAALLPRVAIVPVTGFVTAAPQLAVERFGESLLLFPLRCLEDPVRGLVRELLKLKLKLKPRLLLAQRKAFQQYAGERAPAAGPFEEAVEHFFRFAVGQAVPGGAFTETVDRLIREHFLPAYTGDLFLPPELGPALAGLPPGIEDSRAGFHALLAEFPNEPFVLGVLHADRALRCQARLGEGRSGRTSAGEGIEPRRKERDAHLAAAEEELGKSLEGPGDRRFAYYNLGVLLTSVPDAGGEDPSERRSRAGECFQKSLEGAPPDLWAYKAGVFLHGLSHAGEAEARPSLDASSSSASSSPNKAIPPVPAGSILEWLQHMRGRP